MKGRPIDELVYEAMFPKPRHNDPQNFQAFLTRCLIPEVRHEVHAFYGHLDTPEAKYPGLDYCHKIHRIRLGRWTWHRRLFRAFDNLRLTPAEIQSLTKWEGTRWAKERFEREQGAPIPDTTADGFPRWGDPVTRRPTARQGHRPDDYRDRDVPAPPPPPHPQQHQPHHIPPHLHQFYQSHHPHYPHRYYHHLLPHHQYNYPPHPLIHHRHDPQMPPQPLHPTQPYPTAHHHRIPAQNLPPQHHPHHQPQPQLLPPPPPPPPPPHEQESRESQPALVQQPRQAYDQPLLPYSGPYNGQIHSDTSMADVADHGDTSGHHNNVMMVANPPHSLYAEEEHHDGLGHEDDDDMADPDDHPIITPPENFDHDLHADGGDRDDDEVDAVGNDDDDDDDEFSPEITSVGVSLNQRLRERVALRNASGDHALPLDDEWEQWFKNAIETGELAHVADQLLRFAAAHNNPFSPDDIFPPNMLAAARAGQYDEIPAMLQNMIRASLRGEEDRQPLAEAEEGEGPERGGRSEHGMGVPESVISANANANANSTSSGRRDSSAGTAAVAGSHHVDDGRGSSSSSRRSLYVDLRLPPMMMMMTGDVTVRNEAANTVTGALVGAGVGLVAAGAPSSAAMVATVPRPAAQPGAAS